MGTCRECGKEVKKGNLFCSRSCAATHNNSKRVRSEESKEKVRRAIIDRLPKVERVCKNCKGTFLSTSSTTNYCETCLPSWEKEKKAKKELRGKSPNLCQNCGVSCRSKYCSRKCMVDFYGKKRDLDIEQGVYTTKFNLRVIKNYLLRKRGHICAICLNTVWMGKPIPLEVDHVNGRCLDHTLSNLRLVCGNCAMQLPTYKSKNKNSDRKFRRVY
jgi:hypothetical protein